MINHWMFNCSNVSEKISRSMDETLPLMTRMGIKFHLMMCDLCTNYKKQLDFIRKALLKLRREETTEIDITHLPDDVRKKIKKHLDGLG